MAAKSKTAKTNGATVDDLTRQVETLRDDLSQLTDIMARLGEQQRDAAAADLADRAALVRRSGERALEDAAGAARRFGEEAGRTVRESPVAALAVAAAMGAAFGFLTARR